MRVLFSTEQCEVQSQRAEIEGLFDDCDEPFSLELKENFQWFKVFMRMAKRIIGPEFGNPP